MSILPVFALLFACADGDTDVEDTGTDDSGVEDSGEVEDAAPTIGTVAAIDVYEGEATEVVLDIADDKDGLAVTAVAADPALVVSAEATEGDGAWTLSLTSAGQGATTVTVTVTDAAGQTADTTFELSTWFDRRGIVGAMGLPENTDARSITAGPDGSIYFGSWEKTPSSNASGRLLRLGGDGTFHDVVHIEEHNAYWGREVGFLGDELWVGADLYFVGEDSKQVGGLTRVDVSAGTQTTTSELVVEGYHTNVKSMHVADGGAILTGSWSRLRRLAADGSLMFDAQPVNGSVSYAGAVEGDETLVAASVEGTHFDITTDDYDVMVLRLDAAGTVSTSAIVVGAGAQRLSAMALDAAGELIVCGSTDAAMGGHTHAGELDLFVQKLSSTGTVAWTQMLGAAGDDRCSSLAIGDDGTVYLGGTYNVATDGHLGFPVASQGWLLALSGADGSLTWDVKLGVDTDLVSAQDVAVSGRDLFVLATDGANGTTLQRYDLAGVAQ